MNQYSYSKIRTWSSCPLSYKLTYLDKVGRDEGEPLTLGSAAHEFFEYYVNQHLSNVSLGKSIDLTSIWKEIAVLVWAKEPRGDSRYEDYLDICEPFVKNFDFSEIPKGSKTLCEAKLGLTKEGLACDFLAENVYFRGVIDRLDLNGYTAKITDYKTGFSGKSDALQVNIYAWMVSIYYPEITNFEVVIHYVQSNWKEKWKFSKEILSGIEFQVKAITETIENDKKFKARPGSRCSGCIVAFACDRKSSKTKLIEKKIHAEKIASDILAIEAQLDAKKEMLKSWVQENGEVEVNGEKFSFYPIESVKTDTRELAATLNNNNIDPWDYLKGNVREIKKLCKENDEIANALAQAMVFSTTLRFSHKKID